MIIRELKFSDFEELSDCYDSYYEERRENPYFGLTRQPTKPSTSENWEWFSQFYRGVLAGNNIGIVAEVDSGVVGFCEIQRVSTRPDLAHRAELGISVRKEHRGRGIGTALIAEALRRSREKFEIVELSVASTNDVAKRLYEKAGFKEFGLRPRSAKRGGIYLDEYLMSLSL